MSAPKPLNNKLTAGRGNRISRTKSDSSTDSNNSFNVDITPVKGSQISTDGSGSESETGVPRSMAEIYKLSNRNRKKVGYSMLLYLNGSEQGEEETERGWIGSASSFTCSF